ncbi:MAG: SHOCT domain-containing protein, partial [Gemmatimonadaceae bacterium]
MPPQMPPQMPVMPDAVQQGGNNGWPTPVTPVPNAGAGAASSSSESTTVMEQLKQLAALRDAGVLTPAEFDSKKSELLKRL